MNQALSHWSNRLLQEAVDLLHDTALLSGVAIQIAFLMAAIMVLAIFGPRLRRRLIAHVQRLPPGPSFQVTFALVRVAPWAFFLLALWFGALAFREVGEGTNLLRLAESLVLAWIAIRLTSGLVRNPALASAIAMAAWLFAALNIVGLIDPTIRLLDSMGVTLGHFRLTMLVLLKAAALLTAFIWLANIASRLIEQRLQGFANITPAMQVLASKLARAALLTIAVVAALNSVGLDLTGFALFSGAVGVGVGFGLQKVVSNLISGVILLLDRSIKPGDVIEIEGTYGWITRLNARFVSVNTRDGIEHLIPNEDLITHRVINWSYSDDFVRLHVPLGIGYRSDIREAMELCVDAAKHVPRALEHPPPVCLVKSFGDSSINLELRFWIRDPRNGTANVRSDVMLGIWDRFRERGIEMPFPQRDIHFTDIEPFAGKIGDAVADRLSRPAPRSARER